MRPTTPANHAAQFIKNQQVNFLPKVAIILGSGLGELANHLTEKKILPYETISHFPKCGVKGHGGNLHLGYLESTPVVCCEGRVHWYEGASEDDFKTFIRTLKLLGCETLIVTNAAGSLNPAVKPGGLVLIKDHINFQFRNPLIGPNDDAFGPRFVGMDDVYDTVLRHAFLSSAASLKLPLSEGIYAGVLGPSFETHAEIRLLKALGVDTIAMSVIPEVILARHCGMRVAGISAISNLAAGLHPEPLSHEVTLAGAELASQHLIELMVHVFKSNPALF